MIQKIKDSKGLRLLLKIVAGIVSLGVFATVGTKGAELMNASSYLSITLGSVLFVIGASQFMWATSCVYDEMKEYLKGRFDVDERD